MKCELFVAGMDSSTLSESAESTPRNGLERRRKHHKQHKPKKLGTTITDPTLHSRNQLTSTALSPIISPAATLSGSGGATGTTGDFTSLATSLLLFAFHKLPFIHLINIFINRCNRYNRCERWRFKEWNTR